MNREKFTESQIAALESVIRKGPPRLLGHGWSGLRQADYEYGWLTAKEQVFQELRAMINESKEIAQ